MRNQVVTSLEALRALPDGKLPDEKDLPESLHTRADADLAARSLFSALVYLLLWVLLLSFTDCRTELPTISIGSGLLLVLIGLARWLLGARFTVWHGARPTQWRRAFMVGVLLSAIVWAVLCAALVAQHGLNGNSMVVLLATAGIAAGGSTSLAPRLRLVRAFLLILLLPLIMTTFVQNDQTAQGVAMMVAVYLGFLLIAVRKMHEEYWLGLYTGWLLDRRAADLEQARDKAMAAARAKDEFLTTMSHELRTPLNAILGFSELLEQGHAGPLSDEQQEYLAHVSSSGHHLLELINDILDLAKSDAGHLELNLEAMDGDKLCQSSLELVRAQAQNKKLQLIYTAAPTPQPFIGDKRRLRQILINLLGNAVKFTPEGGEVHLTLAQESSDKVRFSVSDTGIGISPENQQRLFQPFVQLDSSITRQYSGTGLGLALSQRLAGLHGGWIEVRSDTGKGSCFSLVLPRESTPEAR